ncbi:hypothetical protein [Kitasatospora albolonga]|uniref:hypothetical protein n=1 Tax=Kitasatospora albolonga TaxID=68173 RepID=UPI001ABF9001
MEQPCSRYSMAWIKHCNAPLAGYVKTNDNGNEVSYTVRARAFSAEPALAIDVRLTGGDATRTALAVCKKLTRLGASELAKASAST